MPFFDQDDHQTYFDQNHHYTHFDQSHQQINGDQYNAANDIIHIISDVSLAQELTNIADSLSHQWYATDHHLHHDAAQPNTHKHHFVKDLFHMVGSWFHHWDATDHHHDHDTTWPGAHGHHYDDNRY